MCLKSKGLTEIHLLEKEWQGQKKKLYEWAYQIYKTKKGRARDKSRQRHRWDAYPQIITTDITVALVVTYPLFWPVFNENLAIEPAPHFKFKS